MVVGIGFGLVTALSWGLSNYLSKRMIDQIGLQRTLFYSFLVGSLFLALFFLLVDGESVQWSLSIFYLTLLASFLSLMGFLSIYYGFKIGSLSVVATISSGWAVVTVALSLLFLHEMPEPWQQAGIIVTLGGVMLVAYRGQSVRNSPSLMTWLRDPVCGEWTGKNRGGSWQADSLSEGKAGTLGVLPAFCSVLFFGSCYFLMKIITDPLGPILPILIARALGVLVLSLLLLLQGELWNFPRAYLGTLAFIGLLDAGGFIAFNMGMKTTMVSIVSPVASLLTLVTVLLARFYLGERLVANQQVGFWLTLIGVLLLSIV